VVKIQSDPHGDMGSQAEMTWPLTVNVRSNNNDWPWVNLAICWNIRVSDGTRSCHSLLVGW
jgi:hypothetical protein